MAENRKITMELKEQIAVLGKKTNGWTKELNLVSWNGAAPKFDVRDWDEKHERMSKGLTLFDDEMRKLVDGYLRYRNQKVLQNGSPYVDTNEDLYESDDLGQASALAEPGSAEAAENQDEEEDRSIPL